MQSLLPPSRAQAASPCARTPAPYPPAKARSEHRSPLPGPGAQRPATPARSPLHPLRSPLQGRERRRSPFTAARGAAARIPGAVSAAPGPANPAGCRGAGAARVPSAPCGREEAPAPRSSPAAWGSGRKPSPYFHFGGSGASRRTPAAATSSASSGPAPAVVAVAAPAQASEPPRGERSQAPGSRRLPPARAAAAPVRGREGARAQGWGQARAACASARLGAGLPPRRGGRAGRPGSPSNPAPCGQFREERETCPCGLFPRAGSGRRRCVSTPQVCTPPPGCSARRDYKVRMREPPP